MTQKTIEKQIDELKRIADKLAGIAPSLPPPIPPVLVNQGDHDLLQRVDTKVDLLSADIKEIKDGTSKQITDHETRIKALENGITRLTAYGTALIFALGIIQFFINKLWD